MENPLSLTGLTVNRTRTSIFLVANSGSLTGLTVDRSRKSFLSQILDLSLDQLLIELEQSDQ